MMTLAVDPKLTRTEYPAVYALLDRVSETSHEVCDQAKNYWHTERPYVADSRIKALIEPHRNPSYPSGHTVSAYTLAHVLTLLMPEKTAAFYGRAEQVAQHRVLVGMHFPNDLDGGRQLALLISGTMLQKPDFQKDLKAAQQELQKRR